MMLVMVVASVALKAWGTNWSLALTLGSSPVAQPAIWDSWVPALGVMTTQLCFLMSPARLPYSELSPLHMGLRGALRLAPSP